MKSKFLSIALFSASLSTTTVAFAQYPTISPDEEAKADSFLAEAKPEHLPQANIPAFPGAEGGGKVIVVTRNNQDGGVQIVDQPFSMAPVNTWIGVVPLQSVQPQTGLASN